MNQLTLIAFFILIMLGSKTQVHCQVRSVMTYNIKYDNPNDSLNNWNNRKQELVNVFKHYEPEIFGLKEGLEHQLKYLDQHLTNYSRIGVGRDDGKLMGEFSPIYYDQNKFLLISESTFWLSEQNDTISIGWDASMERICTYGLFQNKINQQKVVVLNTHFDHIGKIAREMSSKLIINKLHEINKENYPIILMGDFNAEPETNPIKILKKELNDGSELAPDGIYGPNGTFTGFTKYELAKARIDYIFIKNLKVLKYSHIDDKMKNNNYLSDHLPVLVEFE